ncbi:MAG: formylglycine-generating enzyme family protein [Prevotellaceae bacterium]|nr:formylglycine-generating enzyme family protein [Prevotellaceae bacterium]
MKKNMTFLCALLLVGAIGMMTAGAQGSGSKPTLAVFVVGMQTDALGNDLAQQIGAELNRSSRYDVLPSTNNALANKLTELRKQNASSIDRNALAKWGRANGVSVICLVTDAIKGNDHMFSAQLIDVKGSKLSGKGHYIRTGVNSGELSRVALALARQLDGSERRRSASTPARSYPAELDIEMVYVEGGTFTMGCIPERDGACFSDDGRERPVHDVTLSNFYIGKYKVTRAQWLAVMKDHPTLAKPGNWTNNDDDQVPVGSISWLDIDTAFLPRLNALTGKNYRLPTEAEWEYAARGGKYQEGTQYSGSNNLNEVGWHFGNGGVLQHPVGQKKPNALGVYDMSGSHWELVYDYYGGYSATAVTNPTGPNSSWGRTFRNGNWEYDVSLWPRIATRGGGGANARNVYNSLRLVLPAQ